MNRLKWSCSGEYPTQTSVFGLKPDSNGYVRTKIDSHVDFRTETRLPAKHPIKEVVFGLTPTTMVVLGLKPDWNGDVRTETRLKRYFGDAPPTGMAMFGRNPTRMAMFGLDSD